MSWLALAADSKELWRFRLTLEPDPVVGGASESKEAGLEVVGELVRSMTEVGVSAPDVSLSELEMLIKTGNRRGSPSFEREGPGCEEEVSMSSLGESAASITAALAKVCRAEDSEVVSPSESDCSLVLLEPSERISVESLPSNGFGDPLRWSGDSRPSLSLMRGE